MTSPHARVARTARLPETVFAVWCVDGPDAATLRQRHLDGHLSFIEANHERYLAAGPMRRDGEQRLCGSLLILIADSEAEARRFLSGDPYFSEGIFQSIECRRLTPAAGRWIGGVIWEDAASLRAVADGG